MPESSSPLNKFCNKCKRELPIERFGVRKNGPRAGEYRSPCKECEGETFAEWESKKIQECKGNCDLCHKPLIMTGRGPQIDHCHKTGKIRALLHTRCNAGLGFIEDEELLKLSLEYVKKHK